MDRVRRALEVVEDGSERTRTSRRKEHRLAITERTYAIRWDQGFATNHRILYPRGFAGEHVKNGSGDEDVDMEGGWDGVETEHPENVYYEAQCVLRSEVVARITMSGDAMLSEIAASLVGRSSVSNRMFFVVGSTIYLRSTDEGSVRFATMMFQLRVFDIKTWDVGIGRCIEDMSKEMYFHDGRFLKSIRVGRMFFSHRRIASYVAVQHLQGRAQLCKCCLKNNAVFRVDNDPILPEKKKFLCKRCFELLFLDGEGRNRYEGVETSALY